MFKEVEKSFQKGKVNIKITVMQYKPEFAMTIHERDSRAN
jgi:hypothetical protein